MKPIFIDPYLHPDLKWEQIRKNRNADLAACDYAVMPDYPIEEAQRAELAAYRQALRDIPDQGSNPDAVEWPQKPAFLK
ncbi:tail fiber assembly protein [Pseudomonas aeruginosa]|uniref:tail fiber assembly protein n=1 Tax=Pseudomonas aeruginosa TaxID=287 RepID=UPI002247006C|nr:tail fiber assembly protein [Pseudomonas aeruginosa]MCX2515789.1 tail fiber assembly protein [Pseudomonas aeruginosa]